MADNMDIAYARNLLPDLKPTSIAGWVVFGGSSNIEFRLTADKRAYYIRNKTGGDARGIQYEFAGLPQGNYWYAYETNAPMHEDNETISLVSINNAYQGVVRSKDADDNWHWHSAEFALNASSFKLLFTPPRKTDGAFSVRNLIVATEASKSIMLHEGIQWFDGDSIVREVAA